MENIGGIVIYESSEGISLQVSIEDETVWLTQAQMTKLFDRGLPAINEHLRTIFQEGELERDRTIRKFRIVQKEGNREIVRNVDHYNLDAIISVGYRVNSKRGTQFRIWASTILKQYLTQGYALNQRLLQENKDERLRELREAVDLLRDVSAKKALAPDEARGLLDVITTYARSWVLLQQYDSNALPLRNLSPAPAQPVDCAEVRAIIDALKSELLRIGEASELFGQERGESLLGVLGSITQTYDGIDLYPSIEEKAAHLLYFVIKDHPFVDGNKRIGSLLFVWFLASNHYLLNRVGERKVNDNALVALALLVAESEPSHKETMVALVINLIGSEQ
jgi:prophage maintenance system killer protein